jgi:hypothetical protein
MRETSTILTERKRCDERLASKGGESYFVNIFIMIVRSLFLFL